MINKFNALIKVALVGIIALVFHLLIFMIPSFKELTHGFIYSIPTLYLFLGVFSLLIIFVLLLVNEKSAQQVGYAFLAATSIKMAASYAFMLPVLKDNTTDYSAEKINFFVIFLFFLAIEAFFTIRLLNKKPQN